MLLPATFLGLRVLAISPYSTLLGREPRANPNPLAAVDLAAATPALTLASIQTEFNPSFASGQITQNNQFNWTNMLIIPFSRENYAYQGCFTDSGTQGSVESRCLPQYFEFGAYMTLDLCASACKTAGYPYFAAEFSSECFCGTATDFGSVTNCQEIVPSPLNCVPSPGNDCGWDGSGCSMSCNGNSSQICGGFYRQSIYTSTLNPGNADVINEPQYVNITVTSATRRSTSQTIKVFKGAKGPLEGEPNSNLRGVHKEKQCVPGTDKNCLCQGVACMSQVWTPKSAPCIGPNCTSVITTTSLATKASKPTQSTKPKHPKKTKPKKRTPSERRQLDLNVDTSQWHPFRCSNCPYDANGPVIAARIGSWPADNTNGYPGGLNSHFSLFFNPPQNARLCTLYVEAEYDLEMGCDWFYIGYNDANGYHDLLWSWNHYASDPNEYIPAGSAGKFDPSFYYVSDTSNANAAYFDPDFVTELTPGKTGKGKISTYFTFAFGGSTIEAYFAMTSDDEVSRSGVIISSFTLACQ